MSTGGGRFRRVSDGLSKTLFPEAPDGDRKLRGAEFAIVVVSALAIATFLHLLRLGLSTSLNSFWAEDGSVFFTGALAGESVLAPYTNYLVLLPRLIGAASTWVPLELAPAATSTLAALAAAVSGLAVWVASAGHIRSPYLRLALAAATVLAPVSGLESTDSGSYASWYLLFASFWLLLWRPRTDWGAALASALILLTALSNATVWFLIPIAVLRAIAIRDRRDAMIVASFALGSVIQVPVALTHGQMAEPTWSPDVWSAYAQRVIDGAALGLRLGGIAWRELGWPFLAPFLGLVVAGFAVGIQRAAPPARALAVAAIATSVVMFFAIAYQRDVGTTIAWQSGAILGRSQPLRDRPRPAAAERGPGADRQRDPRPRGPHPPAVAGRGRRRRGHSGDRGVLLPGRTGSAGDSRLGRRRRRGRARMPARRRRRRSGGRGADLAPGIRRLHAMRQDS